jgi:hypothetical protein
MIHSSFGRHVPSVLQPEGPKLGVIPDEHEQTPHGRNVIKILLRKNTTQRSN